MWRQSVIVRLAAGYAVLVGVAAWAAHMGSPDAVPVQQVAGVIARNNAAEPAPPVTSDAAAEPLDPGSWLAVTATNGKEGEMRMADNPGYQVHNPTQAREYMRRMAADPRPQVVSVYGRDHVSVIGKFEFQTH